MATFAGGGSIGVTNLVPTNTPPSTTPSFPTLGVMVSYFQEFITVNGGRSRFLSMTSYNVNTDIIIPSTASAKMSYCEYLKQNGNPAVDDAKVFISHAWGYLFLDLVDALQYYFRNNMDTIVWFDLFSNNQNTTSATFDWYSQSFRSAIARMNKTVMVIAPWSNPITLNRGWCVYEMFCTLTTGSKFDIAMSKEQREQFFREMQNDVIGSMNTMYVTIDAEKSECGVKEDKDKIFAIIRNDVGFNRVNHLIFEAMRKWVLEVTIDELKQKREDLLNGLVNSDDVLVYVNILAKLYSHQTKDEDACNLFEELVRKYRDTKGDEHQDTLRASHDLGRVLNSIQRFSEAENILKSCLAMQDKVLPPDHIDTLLTKSSLANLYFRLNQLGQDSKVAELLDKAAQLQMYCLDAHQVILNDPNHPVILQCKNDLGLTFQRQKKNAEAEQLLTECFNGRVSLPKGSYHTDTLATMHNLGNLYSYNKDKARAKAFYEGCYEKRKELLGEEDNRTLRVMNNLSSVYSDLGEFQRAETMQLRCIEIKKKFDDDACKDDIETLNCLNNMGKIYKKHKMFEKAVPFFKECLEKRKMIFEKDHEHIKQASRDLKECEREIVRKSATGNEANAIAATTECAFYKKGNCKFKDACKFKHY